MLNCYDYYLHKIKGNKNVNIIFRLLPAAQDYVAQIVEREQQPSGDEITKENRFAMHVACTLNCTVLIDRQQCERMEFKHENVNLKKMEVSMQICHRLAKRMTVKVKHTRFLKLEKQLIFLHFNFFLIDIKPCLAQSSTPNHSQNIAIDRNANTKNLGSPSAKLSQMSHSPSRSHINSFSSLSSSLTHSSHNSPLTYSASLINSGPSKYDHSNLSHNSHLSNTSASNYLHSNGMSQTNYANSSIKSEASGTNYDYMNNCLQSGYFGSSFSPLGTSTGIHPVSDLAGYHHQHNVIQAAKLMASS